MNAKKVILTALSAGAVALCLLVCAFPGGGRILGLRAVSRSEAGKIMSRRTEARFDIDIMFKDFCLPEADGACYMTQSLEGDWSGLLSPFSYGDEDLTFRIIDPEAGKSEVIASGEPLKLLAYNDDSYCLTDIIVSGLPLLYIDVGPEDETGEMYGSVTVFDNNSGGRDGVISVGKYGMSMHRRGMLLSSLAKPSYKIELHDESGENLSSSLLNMREDDDWILNPLYTDNSRMREKLAYDLWERMGGDFNHGMEYCEAIAEIDGFSDYIGLYCLRETVDLSTFKKDLKDSFLLSLSIKNFEDMSLRNLIKGNDIADLIDEGSDMIGGLPNAVVLERYRKEQLKDIENVIEYCLNIDEGNTANIRFDSKNQNLYDLFLNFLLAFDNTGNNEKICAVKGEDGGYTLYKTPWDLDFCMNNENYYLMETDNLVIDRVSGKTDFYGIRKIYESIRDSAFDESVFYDKVDGYVALLSESGAFGREQSRWTLPVYEEYNVGLKGALTDYDIPDLSYSRQNLKGFFRQRLEFLDGYYHDILEEAG